MGLPLLCCVVTAAAPPQVDAPLGLASSCCRQMPVASFHSEGRERALEEVSKLYAYVQSLPSGAQKTHFLKKVCVCVSHFPCLLVHTGMACVDSIKGNATP